jgi:hypothetical protein
MKPRLETTIGCSFLVFELLACRVALYRNLTQWDLSSRSQEVLPIYRTIVNFLLCETGAKSLEFIALQLENKGQKAWA